MQEKENILDVLTRTKQAIREKNVSLIKELSNKTVHSASIYSDADNIAVAVIVYALSKIIEREKYQQYEDWPDFFQACMNGVSIAMDALKKDDIKKFRSSIAEIRKRINAISGHLKKYIQDVFRKAEINKASRIYEHGISMQKTAELLGITIFELAEYAGSTGIADVNLSITMDIKKRINIAEEFLS